VDSRLVGSPLAYDRFRRGSSDERHSPAEVSGHPLRTDTYATLVRGFRYWPTSILKQQYSGMGFVSACCRTCGTTTKKISLRQEYHCVGLLLAPSSQIARTGRTGSWASNLFWESAIAKDAKYADAKTSSTSKFLTRFGTRSCLSNTGTRWFASNASNISPLVKK